MDRDVEMLIELIANSMVEGNAEQLTSLAKEEGLSPSIANGLQTISEVFQSYVAKRE